MYRHSSLAAMLLLIMALGLTACGGGAAPTEEPTAEPTETPTPLPLGFEPVTRNADWASVVQDFDGVEMALVPAGCFIMGSTDEQIDYVRELTGSSLRLWFVDEQPAHEVCFEEPFWVDVIEVTNGQFAEFGGEAGWESYWTDADHPRERITWTEAAAFCELRGVRLPTEAEWEYTARGPDGLAFPWGNTFDGTQANYCDSNCEESHADANGNDGYPYTAPVGSYPGGVSWVGAYDLSGNVEEWVADWYDEDYYSTLSTPAVNPQGPSSGEWRVLRGGSWFDYSDGLTGAGRSRDYPDYSYRLIGFRCARDY